MKKSMLLFGLLCATNILSAATDGCAGAGSSAESHQVYSSDQANAFTLDNIYTMICEYKRTFDGELQMLYGTDFPYALSGVPLSLHNTEFPIKQEVPFDFWRGTEILKEIITLSQQKPGDDFCYLVNTSDLWIGHTVSSVGCCYFLLELFSLPSVTVGSTYIENFKGEVLNLVLRDPLVCRLLSLAEDIKAEAVTSDVDKEKMIEICHEILSKSK